MKKNHMKDQSLQFGDHFEPFIRHIRFPHYKNLAENTKIEFTYPITALVGANGTNKSSILRSIQGCPGRNNLGNYWFSTNTDSIFETEKAKNCFIYGYKHSAVDGIVEVLKTRVQKQNDPDYWEPSRPIRKYAMASFSKVHGNKNKTRWDTISKPTIYIDFRNILPAFDKYFYQTDIDTDASSKRKKDFIRTRSRPLKSAIRKNIQSHIYYRTERILSSTNRKLDEEHINNISDIIGKRYDEIFWIHHRYFNVDGFTAVLKSKDLNYTEAFAGSGEFAVVRLVVELLAAPKKSLILLDEPEVSLHPGAQEKLERLPS